MIPGMSEPHQRVLSNPAPQGFSRRKTYFTDENLILKYVHKKFGVTTISTQIIEDKQNLIQEANRNHRQV
jgi:hypothetical protein